MSKAVMLSIQPHWCEMIANGEKTIEIRKTRPKLETPFKCYIYCTKPRFEHEDFFALVGKQGFYGGGKVIGEFVCDRVDRLARIGYVGSAEKPRYRIVDERMNVHGIYRILEEACLTEEALETYLKRGVGFGWHISDLRIYDEPLAITRFRNCKGCEYTGDCDVYCWKPMRPPPQSWCYVEEIG